MALLHKLMSANIHTHKKLGQQLIPTCRYFCKENFIKASNHIELNITPNKIFNIFKSQNNAFFLRLTQIRNISFSNLRYSRSTKKMPFEVDGNVARDTRLFAYNNDRYFKMLSLFGIIQFIFWINIAGFVYTGLNNLKLDNLEEKSKEAWWGKVLKLQAQYKDKFAIMCLLLGYAILAFVFIAPQRSVTRLYLLRGGENVKIETYTHFARKKEFTVPLSNISFNQPRTTNANQVSMKVKGKKLYFQLDKKDGKFFETELYDYVVGLKRDLS